MRDRHASNNNGKAARVRPPAKSSAQPASRKSAAPTVAERFDFLIGKADGLPTDFSRNLDHYLYGAPRQP
jgi:hypothetical protein